MLALYLLTQLPYTHGELFLKANLEHIWHIAGPVSLRISIICLSHEHCVIKIQNSIDHFAFFCVCVFFCYRPWNSSLVPKLLFVFPVVFSYTDTRTILSASVLTSF